MKAFSKIAAVAAGVLVGAAAPAQTRVWDWIFSMTGNAGGNYESPLDSAMDPQGNLISVGTTGGPADLNSPATSRADWVVLKRRLDGSLAWWRRFNGPGNGLDAAYSVAVDSAGVIYVAGTSYAGVQGLNARVVAYNPDGVQLWERVYNSGNATFDGYRKVAIDGAGDLVLAGTTVDGPAGQRWLVEKRKRTNGDFVFGRTFGVRGAAGQTAVDIGTDSLRNLYVFGNTVGSGFPLEMGVASWSSEGTFRWSRTIASPDFAPADAARMHVSPTGLVTVAGTVPGAGLNGDDFAAARFTPTGGLAWLRVFNTGPGRADVTRDLAVDGQGNAYLVGGNAVAGFALSDFVVVAMRAADGTAKYLARIDGGGNRDDEALACWVDSSGYLAVAGEVGLVQNGFLRPALGVRFLDPNGALMAVGNYPDASAQPFSMQVVGRGDVLYVAGATQSATSGMDWVQLRYRLDPALAGLSVSPIPLIGSSTGVVRVNLNLPAPAGGTRVRFRENSSLVNGIPDLVIPQGQQTGLSAFAVAGTSSPQAIVIEAELGLQRLAQTVPVSPSLVSLTSASTAIAGGNPFSATVTLAGPAPIGGTPVRLQSLNPFLQVPATVRVPAGQRTATFVVATSGVAATSVGTYRALLGSSAIPRNVTVRLPLLTALETPSTVRGGQDLVATVRLDGVASVPRTLALSDNSANVNAPPTATILAGQRSATIRIPTTAVMTPQTVELTVRLGTQVLRRTFTLN